MRSRQLTGFLAVAALATLFVFLGSGSAAADANDPTTSISLALSTNLVALGDPVTLTATVTGEGNPTGSVEFDADSGSGPMILGTVPVTAVDGSDTDSQAILTTDALPADTYTITATYNSDSFFDFFGGTSDGHTLIVSSTPVYSTVTTLTASPSGTVPYAAPVTFTAHVAENDGGTMIPTGTVTFDDITADPSDPVPLGSATLDASGNATVVTTGFLSNPHVISASYAGDSSDQASASSINVQVAPDESSLLAPTNTTVNVSPSEIIVGDSTTFFAHVSPAPAPNESVTFTANGNFAGQSSIDANGNASLTVSSWGQGTYDIQASYGGDDVNLGSAGDATLTVDPGISTAVPTTTSLTVSPAPITAAQVTTLYAHVVQTNGSTLPPQGELVTFTANGAVLGQVPLDVNGNASLMVGGWTAGTYDLQATYGGDTFDAPSSHDFSLTVTSERTGPPAPLTVTAPSVSMTYGGHVPTLPNPTYDGFVDGDTVASLTSPATCSTVVTSASPVGTYPVTCTGASDVNYGVTYVAGTVTINPVNATITGPAASMTYGGAVSTFAAPTYSGFVNGDTAGSLTTLPTCTTTATSGSPVGSYPVNCSGAVDPNYAFTYVPGTLTVGAAALTITGPASVSMVYGGAVPTLTPTFSGLVAGDTAASLSTAPACSTAATSSSSIGNYPVTCSGAVDPNYTIGYAPGQLTVTRAPLTVTGPSPSMTYGGIVPTIAAPTYSGFVNGDTKMTLSSLATCTTAVTSASPVGSYSVTCSGAAGANYSINYAPGQLTVNPALLTVTGSSTASMTYGGNVPAIPAPTYSGFVNGDTKASLTSLPVCTTTASSSSPVGAYPVNCSGAAAVNYTFAYVAGQLTVNRAVLTVTAPAAATMTFGDNVPTLTPTYSGFENGDSASSITTLPTCSTLATSSSPVGSYAVNCSGAAAANYTFTYVVGQLSVTPAVLTITGSSPSMTYGGIVPTLTPTYSGFVNGNTSSSLSTLPSCSTTGTSHSAVGTYAVTCSAAAAANYTFVYAPGVLTVNPAVLTVTGSTTGSMTYGGNVPAIPAPTYSGFVNGDTTASLTSPPTCSTTATSSSSVGSYPVNCSGAAAANYTFTYASGHLTVIPAVITVTGSSAATMTYGGSVPGIPAPTYAGFVNGDTAGALTSLASCSTTASSSSSVGNYPVNCSGAAAANYTFTYVAGQLSVTPAVLTIKAPSPSMTYGGNVPTLSPTYSGFLNGDLAGSLGTGPTCATTGSSNSAVGTYPVSCSGAAATNYTFVYVGGQLTVGPAALTVSAPSAATMTYGGNPPTLTPAYTGFVNGDTASSLVMPATCSTAATSSSPVGNYPVTCSGAVATNYTVSYVGGQLAVTPAVVTVTGSATATMTYGGAVPAIPAPTYAGFVNGDTAAALTTLPSCSTTATSHSGVGTYGVTCSGAAAANYTFSYVAGQLAVTPAVLTITPPSPSMTYGGNVPTLSPNYSGFVNGDLAGSLSTRPTCSTSGSSTSGVGTYPITCTGAAALNYTFVYVGGQLTVNAAALTVTGSTTASMTYGGSVPAIPAPTYGGFVNGDTPSSLIMAPTCTTTATSSSPAGSYPVTCSGAVATNYSISYVAGQVTVSPALVTVTGSSAASMVYGGAVPAIPAPTYAGFVNGDTTAALTTLPTCSTTASSTSPVGTYAVNCSGATAANYTFSYTAGQLAVTPAALTITGSSPSMIYGGNVPTLSAIYSGFVNGDSASSLSTRPTCSTTGTSHSAVGTYAVTCSGAAATNYTFTYAPGQLTVTPSALTVTPAAATMTYGGNLPTFTPSYTGFVNGDTAASLTTPPTCSTVATSSSPVGTYLVACSGAVDANYTISYSAGHLTVTPAALTITGSTTASMTYGATVPAIPAPTYAGFVNGDMATSLTTQPVCTTTASSTSSVGTYAVNCSGATAANYTINYVAGRLAVTPATLTVSSAAATMVYGGTVPTLSPTYSGFVNGNTSSSLTAVPTCSTMATSRSAVGTYAVTCSGAAATNYTFTYAPGQLTVGPAALTVTAPSLSMVAGAAVPALPATYTGFVNGETSASLTTLPSCTTTASSSSPAGTYAVICSGAVDANYTITYVAGTLTVTPAGKVTTLAYTGPTSGSYTDPILLSATLTTANGAPVSGANVTLSLGSQSCNAVTTSGGNAVCLLILLQPAGTYQVTASFAAGNGYQASSARSTFTITPKDTNIYAFYSGPVATGSTVTLSAWLTEDLILPVANKTVTLSLGSQSCTAVTGPLGLAECQVTVSGPLGPTTANAVFAGDSSFAASSDSNSALIYAYAPGGGSFVVCDRSASGTTVTFWGSQWSKANSMSGGAPPAGFKGFAPNTGTPDVGDRWSTGSNANPTPPSGSLPTYMAVIVTSSAGKSGSSITGNVSNIVIVKTNPGYSPNGTGTGTVVTTLD